MFSADGDGVARGFRLLQTAPMNDLAEKWRQRLPILEAQLRSAPRDMSAWHWRAEIRVLHFLLNRYAKPENAMEPNELLLDEIASVPMSPLERSLLKMALLIPNIHTKRTRPSENERANILERIKVVGDEARIIDEAEQERWGKLRLDSKIQLEASAYQDLLTRQSKIQRREIKQRSRKAPHQKPLKMPIHPKRDITAFGPRFPVVCPRCSRCADLEQENSAKITLDCLSCGYARQWQSSQIQLASGWRWLGKMAHPVPAGFGGTPAELWIETSSDATQQSQGLTLRLWLQTPCDEENLWFLNREHLNFVEHYLRDSANVEDQRTQIQWVEPWIWEADEKCVARCLAELRLKMDAGNE